MFVVRKGNPKGVKDWDDLVRDCVKVITPNPKTSGGARWNHLAAWAWADKQYSGDRGKILNYMKLLYANVPVLDAGARGSAITFAQRGIGDALLSWENEAWLIEKEFPGKTTIVYPSISILAEPPVAVVAKNAAKHGTAALAKAYLEFLYTDEAQEIAGQNGYRSRDPAIAAKFRDKLPEIPLVTIDRDFGGWGAAQKVHFDDGGTFDQVAGSRGCIPPKTIITKQRVLPGFGLSMGFSILYLSLVILIPLTALFLKAANLGWSEWWHLLTSPRVVAATKLTFGASAAAAGVSVVLGLLVTWMLVRYEFPGRRLLDAMVDLPFALPTAVAGITLTQIYAPNGWIGSFFSRGAAWTIATFHPTGWWGEVLAGWAEKGAAYSPLGVFIALAFIGFPFVVRRLQPVMPVEAGNLRARVRVAQAGKARRFGKPPPGPTFRRPAPARRPCPRLGDPPQSAAARRTIRSTRRAGPQKPAPLAAAVSR